MATHVYRERVISPETGRPVVHEEIVRNDSVSNAGWGIRRVLYVLLNILESLLAIRFLLKLFAANPGSPFVQFMYNITAPFVAPFRGIFSTPTSSGYTLEWSTLVAMAIYALIVYAVAELFTPETA